MSAVDGIGVEESWLWLGNMMAFEEQADCKNADIQTSKETTFGQSWPSQMVEYDGHTAGPAIIRKNPALLC